VVRRFRGAARGQLGHRPSGTGPYCGQRQYEVEAEVDITADVATLRGSPEMKGEERADALYCNDRMNWLRRGDEMVSLLEVGPTK
jgi:hypothetical protein